MNTPYLEKKARKFLGLQLAEDPDYLDNVTDSWIDDAADWFENQLTDDDSLSFDEYADLIQQDALEEFRNVVKEQFDKIYRELYGYRDAKILLKDVIDNLEKERTRLLKFAEDYNVGKDQEMQSHFQEAEMSIQRAISEIKGQLNKK